MSNRTEVLQILAGILPKIEGWREDARLACAASPLHWLAVQGVPLSIYLSRLNELERLCQKAMAELAEAQP